MDWSASMQQTYEFYVVNPYTWMDVEKIDKIITCTIRKCESNDTFYSAAFTTTEVLDENYIRVYLIAKQGSEIVKKALGTFLIQSPSFSFNGVYSAINIDGYSPLIELNEKYPPLGFTMRKGITIVDRSIELMAENMRAPVTRDSDETKKLENHLTANSDDTWLSLLKYTMSIVGRKIYLDGDGKAYFPKTLTIDKRMPSFEFDDGNSSILYPDITDSRDWYGIPNVVEVYYNAAKTYRIVNNDPNSPTSVQNRGREIIYRDLSPSFQGVPDEEMLHRYAVNLLKALSTVEHSVSFSHGYCGTEVGDCILLNYNRAGMQNVKAVITEQSIECVPGCKVDETAVYTTALWSPSDDEFTK